MINLKIYSLLLITMLLVITFNVNTHNARATNGLIDESYEIFSNQIEKVKQLDNEKKDKYEEFIDIVDGQYEFSYKEEDNEETLFIKQNIKSINELVSNGYAKIEGDDVILQNENELYAQFGVSSVKWKWYGLNFKMDREMMITISVASLAVRIFGGYVKNLIINGKFSSTSFEQKIKNLIKNSISSYNTYETYGLRTLNKTVILLDEKTGELTSIVEGFITAGLSTFISVQTALAYASGGIFTIITQVFNYVLGLFMPSTIDAILMMLGGTVGLYTICNAQIRWFKGFGGYYSYM